MSGHPLRQPRRLRRTAILRELVRETILQASDLVMPIFLVSGAGQRRPIASMPGIFQVSADVAASDVRDWWKLGIRAVMLFGLPPIKDARGSGADDPDGVVQQAIPVLKAAVPELLVIADVCLCEYTDHGHCGVVEGETVLNAPSVTRLAESAVSYAKAGADMVAPSDMMDGRVGTIRRSLDEAGFDHVPIMSYAVKYASAFYGPFREAAESAPSFGDRKTYQMDPANAREAFVEAALDEAEGADILMVKPALPYLDVLARLREKTHLPLAAYHVSGEYAMIKAAAAQGWVDEDRIVLESLTAIRRAGADLIITYYAVDAARYLRESAGT
jgi:porphobilinogen synthase